MDELDVKMVTLPPMRVICFNGFGPSPEGLAFAQAADWLKANGMWEDGKERRFYGYNNPDPSPGSPNYGYDVWVTVEVDVQAGGGGRIIDFPGGLFAVTSLKAGPNGEGIFETWQKLTAWVEHSGHKAEFSSRPCLEGSPDPFHPAPDGFSLDLYEPVSE